MKTLTLLEGIRKRVPWYSMRPVFKALELPTGQGWDASIVKVISEIEANPTLDEQLSEHLVRYYEEQLQCGEKLVQLYLIDKDVASTLYSSLTSYDVPDSSFLTSFPVPLTEEALIELKDKPTLVKVLTSSTEIKLVLCTAREYEEQVQLHASDLKPEVVSDFDLTDKVDIVVKRKRVRQFFDVVSINKETGILQVRVDWGLGLKASEARKSFLMTLKKFKELSKEATSSPLELDLPLNLFPLVNELYADNTVGRVCELGFTVNSGSVKTEKLRRSDTDIRSEKFHQAGREAVDGQLSPYRLAIEWRLHEGNVDETRPELSLLGTIRHLNNPNKTLLNEALVSKCFREEDFCYILGVIMNRLLDGIEDEKSDPI